MRRRTRVPIVVAVVLAIFCVGAAALSRTPYGSALLKSRDHFIQSDHNPNVFFEPGMEAEGALAADALRRAMVTVESQHHLPLAKAFRVYVCATQESFNEYMGAPPGATARGVKVGNSIFLSPETFASWRGDTHEGVLAHELSHLHIYQRLGHVK